jgi:hypothetical protein
MVLFSQARKAGYVFSTVLVVAHALDDSSFMSCPWRWLFGRGTRGAVCFFRLGRLVGAKKPPAVGLTPTSAKIDLQRHHSTAYEHDLACSDFSLCQALSSGPNECPITYIDKLCCCQQPVTRD